MFKDLYGPADIARICRKERAEVENWLKEGKIASFTVPGGHRRVTHHDFRCFLEETGIPEPEDWKDGRQRPRVLLVEDDPDLLEIISELLKDEPGIDIRAENNGFTAGFQIAGWGIPISFCLIF